MKQIEEAAGPEFLADLMEIYGYDDEDVEEIKKNDNETDKSSDKLGDSLNEPTIKVEETLRQEDITEDKEDELAPAPPLTPEGKAILEQALSGQLIKGYSAEYTREQWDKMSRSEREERGLPVSRAGIIGFDFKEDVDKLLEAPIRNLTIKRNLDDKNYKIKIKGRGTFTVTKEIARVYG